MGCLQKLKIEDTYRFLLKFPVSIIHYAVFVTGPAKKGILAQKFCLIFQTSFYCYLCYPHETFRTYSKIYKKFIKLTKSLINLMTKT